MNPEDKSLMKTWQRVAGAVGDALGANHPMTLDCAVIGMAIKDLPNIRELSADNAALRAEVERLRETLMAIARRSPGIAPRGDYRAGCMDTLAAVKAVCLAALKDRV